MSKGGDRIIAALDEVLAWSRGEGTLSVWLPDGRKADVTVEEYEHFRLGKPIEGSGRNRADANQKHPNRRET